MLAPRPTLKTQPARDGFGIGEYSIVALIAVGLLLGISIIVVVVSYAWSSGQMDDTKVKQEERILLDQGRE